jgi:hypothetical protein
MSDEQRQQREQSRLCTELEHALRSRKRLTVQAMPNGCEIIDVESGDLIKTVRLSEVPEKRCGHRSPLTYDHARWAICTLPGDHGGEHRQGDLAWQDQRPIGIN